MRGAEQRLRRDPPLRADSHETDGVIGTQLERRKTDENLGRTSLVNKR
jgi:hypothetical protein